MASEKLFRDIPPFPDDIPTATIETISLTSLAAHDEAASQSLLAACRKLGFFMLNLSGNELGNQLIDEIDQLFLAGNDIMNLPPEIKGQYLMDAPKDLLGFKQRGTAKTETGEPDRFEWLNISQDGLVGNTALQPLPPLVHDLLPLFTSFLQHSQTIVTMISTTLATQLNLPPDTFTSLQDPTQASGTILRLIKVFSTAESLDDCRTSMIHHTDFGTITLLANVLGGLQILTPGRPPSDAAAWLWVKPRPGCLVVGVSLQVAQQVINVEQNLGDAMVQWTGGLLRSNVHRIRYPPGAQSSRDRLSLALLVRPERNASMRRLIRDNGDDEEEEEDSHLTAWEWEVKKTMALKRGDACTESKGGAHVKEA